MTTEARGVTIWYYTTATRDLINGQETPLLPKRCQGPEDLDPSYHRCRPCPDIPSTPSLPLSLPTRHPKPLRLQLNLQHRLPQILPCKHTHTGSARLLHSLQLPRQCLHAPLPQPAHHLCRKLRRVLHVQRVAHDEPRHRDALGDDVHQVFDPVDFRGREVILRDLAAGDDAAVRADRVERGGEMWSAHVVVVDVDSCQGGKCRSVGVHRERFYTYGFYNSPSGASLLNPSSILSFL